MPIPPSFDWLAVLVSTLVASGLGAAWYSPALFGDTWLAAIGKTQEDLGSPGPAIAGSVVTCLVAACAVEYVTETTGAESVLSGAGIGAVLGVAVVSMAMLSDALFSGWGMQLYAIQAGYRAVYLVIMGAICGGWPW